MPYMPTKNWKMVIQAMDDIKRDHTNKQLTDQGYVYSIFWAIAREYGYLPSGPDSVTAPFIVRGSSR